MNLTSFCTTIAYTAWLTVQYSIVRQEYAKQGIFLTKSDYVEKPGYMIAVSPIALLAIMEAQIPFVQPVVQSQNVSAPLISPNSRLQLVQ